MVQQIAIIIHSARRFRAGLCGATELLAGGTRVKVFLLGLKGMQPERLRHLWHLSARTSKPPLYVVDGVDGIPVGGAQEISLATMVRMLKQMDHVIAY